VTSPTGAARAWPLTNQTAAQALIAIGHRFAAPPHRFASIDISVSRPIDPFGALRSSNLEAFQGQGESI
jgi:hypothetical protein